MERTRAINIHVARHAKTGMLMATSPEMSRLMVAAVSEAELEMLLPDVIRSLLEADGLKVIEVTLETDQAGLPPGFTAVSHIANAVLQAA